MNIERLTELAEWLEAGAPEKAGVVEFDMSDFINVPLEYAALERAHDWVPSCGTACCIAGAAVQFEQARVGREPWTPGCMRGGAIMDKARGLLGLDELQAGELFVPGYPGAWRDIRPDYAARVIRKLIETGFVDWRGTKATP